MIDASYFRDRFRQDLAAIGDVVVVEVRLVNGRLHRVHKFSSIENGYIVLDVYDMRGNEVVWKENWQEQVFDGSSASDVSRAIVPYESIVDVVVLPGQRASNQPRIGFGTSI